MSNTLITADLHLTANPRDAYRHSVMKRMHAFIRKHAVSRLLILGDLTEEKDRHSAELVNAVVDRIVGLTDLVDITILLGNHDYADRVSPFFAFLGKFPRITWVDKPTMVENWWFLPHTRDHQRDWSGLNMKTPDWIFAHNTFQGADVGHGRKMDGISLNLFPKKNVIAGDIHIPQTIGPVTYVGAPYTVDFGDDYEPRMLLLSADKRTELLQSIPIQGPQKRLVEISDVAELKRAKVNWGDIVKVRCAMHKTTHWLVIKDMVREWADKVGCTLYAVVPTVEKGGGVAHVRPAGSTIKSDEVVTRDFAKAREVDKTTLAAGLKLL